MANVCLFFAGGSLCGEPPRTVDDLSDHSQNHLCNPNMRIEESRFVDPRRLPQIKYITQLNIAASEELTISYHGIDMVALLSIFNTHYLTASISKSQ